MKAAQITRYSKDIQITVNDIPVPEIGDEDIFIRVKAAAVNPVDILNLTGSVRLIQDYKMPLTLGNECSGIVEKVGRHVTRFRPGDRVYCRMPIGSLGAFVEYASVPELAAARMPEGLDFATAAAIPLTGLTAYQALTEELCAKPGQTLFIPGGSGSFGQMAVPIAKALGLRVIVSGNARAKDALVAAGADRYLVYTEENYWETLSGVDFIIDTLGEKEFDHELSVLKENGILLSLRDVPNGAFAQKNGFPLIKGFCSRWQAQNTTGKPNGRLRRTGSCSCGRMERSWRELPRLLR